MRSRNTLLAMAAIVPLALAQFARAGDPYDPDWELAFTSSIGAYTDSFGAAVGPSPATDGYDAGTDVLQPDPPSGTYVEMKTSVGGYWLTTDIRSPLELLVPKTWSISLYTNSASGLSGTNEILWIIPEPLNEPGNEPLLLIDYGTDETRTNIVSSVNMREQGSYSFSVTNASGVYRYLDFEAELVPEPATVALLILGVGIAGFRKRAAYSC